MVTDSVILHPNPSAPLAERWTWALTQQLRGGSWIAWGVEGPERAKDGSYRISSNSPGSPGAYTSEAPLLGAALAGASAVAPRVAFLFGFAGEGDSAREIDWIRIRTSNEPVGLAGRPLVWLGPASTGESLELLRRLYSVLDDPALRKEVAAALALHEGRQETLQAVIEVMDQDRSPDVRAEAVQWLQRTHPDAEILPALLRAAFEDPSEVVRREAVDAIINLRSDDARDALVRIAEIHPDSRARSEAAQALAGRSR